MRPVRILLAEDDPAHQRLLLDALARDRPFVDVCPVATGAECLRAIRRRSFDCLVIDYKLPDATADELLRTSKKELDGCPALIVSSNPTQAVAVSSFRSGSIDFVAKTEALCDDGLWRRVERAIRDAQARISGRRRIERRQSQLARLTETDQLTGLYNRRYLDRQLQGESYQRDRRRETSCILMDVDHFKRINDTYGHAAGDAVLKHVAGILHRELHGGDAALRWGGDEFLILRFSTDLGEAWAWSEELMSRIGQETFHAGRKDLAVAVSLGIVSFPTPQMGYEMIERADQALYLAKRQGRERVCTWAMVTVDHALARLAKAAPSTPEGRRRELLALCKDAFGPTQKEHLTTHSEEVATLVEQLGRAMELPEERLAGTRLAGLLHDLGKAVIPEEVMARPGSLTEGEWTVMRRHADLGADMSLRLGAKPETAACIRYHHRPYRSAFEGPFASLDARLICVADALSAMMANRPYRAALSAGEAWAELRRGTGSQFDPAVVAAANAIEPFSSLAAA